MEKLGNEILEDANIHWNFLKYLFFSNLFGDIW